MKQPKSILSGTMRLSLLLLTCAFLLVGVTWARYQIINDPQIFSYTLKDYSFVYLWNSYDEETGAFRSDQSTWQTQGDQKTLDFCVSNGTAADEFAQADQQVHIRLLLGLGAWSGTEEIDLLLRLPQTGETVRGHAQPIAENSPAHSTFGEGWVICFCGEDGEEVSWILEGDQLSYLDGQIVARNMEVQGTTLMQLQVIGDALA